MAAQQATLNKDTKLNDESFIQNQIKIEKSLKLKLSSTSKLKSSEKSLKFRKFKSALNNDKSSKLNFRLLNHKEFIKNNSMRFKQLNTSFIQSESKSKSKLVRTSESSNELNNMEDMFKMQNDLLNVHT